MFGIVAMAVVGGLGSIFGSIIGSAMLIAVPQALTAFQEYEHAILGAIVVVVMIALRRGIVPTLQQMLLRRWG
jgi:branched-chain amino acid transport system permease protein